MEDLSEGLGQVLVSDRMGAQKFTGPEISGCFMRNTKASARSFMDPRKHCLPLNRWVHDKLLEERNHLPQGSPFFPNTIQTAWSQPAPPFLSP